MAGFVRIRQVEPRPNLSFGRTLRLSSDRHDLIPPPLMLHTAATQALRFLRFAPRNSQNLMKHQRCGAQKKLVVACAVSLRRTEA